MPSGSRRFEVSSGTTKCVPPSLQLKAYPKSAKTFWYIWKKTLLSSPSLAATMQLCWHQQCLVALLSRIASGWGGILSPHAENSPPYPWITGFLCLLLEMGATAALKGALLSIYLPTVIREGERISGIHFCCPVNINKDAVLFPDHSCYLSQSITKGYTKGCVSHMVCP